jgi:hypothetical protein
MDEHEPVTVGCTSHTSAGWKVQQQQQEEEQQRKELHPAPEEEHQFDQQPEGGWVSDAGWVTEGGGPRAYKGREPTRRRGGSLG